MATATIADSKLQLITVELFDTDASVYYVRNVLCSEKTNIEDMEFYYHHMLGFDGYRVELHQRPVPDTFTLGLLGSLCSEIPTQFPAYDVRFTDGTALKRYYRLVEQVCGMEELREECGVNTVIQTHAAEVDGRTPLVQKRTANNDSQKFKSWIRDILSNMNSASDDLWTTKDAQTIEDKDTIAWILMPILEDIRDKQGSRVLTSTTLGSKWSALLGTELFPDLVVCRRLSTVHWRIQTPRSKDLARLAIEWYLEGQMLESSGIDGMSPWIRRAERELASVLVPFQNVGPHQVFNPIHEATANDDDLHQNAVVQCLKKVEQTYLVSTFSKPDAFEPELATWKKYTKVILKNFQITSDMLERHDDEIDRVVRNWIRGKIGVDFNAEPIFKSWVATWNMLVADCPVEKQKERFEMFVDTIHTYDPIIAHTLPASERYALTDRWIRMFVELETYYVPDSTERVRAIPLYAVIRKWCLQFLPYDHSNNALKATNINPVITNLGYRIVKYKHLGRMVHNMRLRRLAIDSALEFEAEVSPPPGSKGIRIGTSEKAAENAPPPMTPSAFVASVAVTVASSDPSLVAPPPPKPALSFATSEIHLGTL